MQAKPTYLENSSDFMLKFINYVNNWQAKGDTNEAF